MFSRHNCHVVHFFKMPANEGRAAIFYIISSFLAQVRFEMKQNYDSTELNQNQGPNDIELNRDSLL